MLLSALVGVYLATGGAKPADAICPSEFARSGGEKIAFCKESSVPDAIVALARLYLASSTSPSYQQEQYVLVPGRTGVQRLTDCHGEAVAYQLIFEYAALRRVNAKSAQVSFFLPVDPKCLANGFVAVRAADGTIVEPKVSQEDAVEVARHAVAPLPSGWGFSYASLLPRPEAPVAGWQWNVYFRGPEKGGCFEELTLVVDAATRAVVTNTKDSTCY